MDNKHSDFDCENDFGFNDEYDDKLHVKGAIQNTRYGKLYHYYSYYSDGTLKERQYDLACHDCYMHPNNILFDDLYWPDRTLKDVNQQANHFMLSKGSPIGGSYSVNINSSYDTY